MFRYMQFVAETGRNIGSTDEMKARAVQFKKANDAIEHHNEKYLAGKTLYTKGHN